MRLKTLAVACSLISVFGSASAGTTDTVDFYSPGTTSPTYFLDSDANRASVPYYRWTNEDWSWTHNPIAGSFTTATLNISAFDIDYSSGERDEIFAFSGGAWKSLGFLQGANNAWAFSSFSLDSSLFPDINNGLQIKLDIDTTDAGWAVTLAKSSLSVDGGSLPVAPPVPEPETYAMLLAGLGIVGAMARRKKAS